MSVEALDPDNPYEFEFTPKQRENWEKHGRPVFEAMKQEQTKEWYIRTYRPKARNSGMKKRDHVETGEPEKYLHDRIERFEKPRTTSRVSMAGAFVDDGLKEQLGEIAVRIVAAKVNGGELSQGAARRIVKNNRRVANLFGVEA